MLVDFIIALLWSLSPFGEAKVGIPYGMLQGVNIYLVFVGCFLANVLVFPNLDVDMASLIPLTPENTELSGRLTGSIGGSPIACDLRLNDTAVRFDTIQEERWGPELGEQ